MKKKGKQGERGNSNKRGINIRMITIIIAIFNEDVMSRGSYFIRILKSKRLHREGFQGAVCALLKPINVYRDYINHQGRSTFIQRRQ